MGIANFVNSAIYKNIYQLIADGHEEGACILIREVWTKRESDNQEKIAKLILRAKEQEWRCRTGKQ